MFVMRTQVSPLVSLISSEHDNTKKGPFLTQATGQVGKVLGERWKALNESQRRPYEAKAATDKKRYEDAKATYLVSLHITSL